MFRSRRSNARKKNSRKRNKTRTTSSDDDFLSSDSWDTSSLSDSDSSETSEEQSLPSRPTSRRPNHRKCAQSKRKNAKNSKRTNRRRSNLANPGPSTAIASTSSSGSSLRESNIASKRKCKERSRVLESDETSSDDLSTHIQAKRLRHSYLDSDDTDDSVVHPVTSRKTGFIQSESSSPATSSEICIRRFGPRPGCSSRLTWSSDETDDSIINTRLENTNLLSGDTTSVISSSPSSSSSSFLSSSSMNSSIFSNSSSFGSIFNTDIDMSASSNESSNQELASTLKSGEQISSDSDESDSEGEKCAICLKKFRTQQIGTPSNCDHRFCRRCLEEWSKSSTTCPVDRSVFDAIIVRNEIDGEVIERIVVQNRNFVLFPPVDIEEMAINETIICETCGSGDDEETLLLCDLCNLGYHMACLTPPLEAVPAGSWYCPPCRLLSNSNQNMREAMRRLISNLPFSSVALSQSPSRQSQNRSRPIRTRIPGPPPRGRGPTASRRLANARARNDLANVIGDEETVRTPHQRRARNAGLRLAQNGRPQRSNPSDLAAQMTRYLAEVTNSRARIDRRFDEMLTLTDSSTSRPSNVVDMVFPSFSLFGNNDLEYFSDDQNGDGLDGEVAIMARVQSEYSARRIGNRKNIATNLINPRRRTFDAPMIEMNLTEDCSSTTSLLDSILESQTLWHSKNVEISSKKDGKLEVRLKNGEDKRPDLSNPNHSSKEIPLYPNKSDSSASDANKSYANNTRYSNFGGNSSSGSTSFTQPTSFFNSLNPSTRPGFSSLLGNNSSALDLSPFRGTAPIRFRMNPPRSGLRRSNYNANTRPTAANSAVANNNASSRKTSAQSARCGSGEDDVDLYDDIETENSAETERATELYASLEPPPEPPALLIGSDSSSDEDNGLIIDDKAGGATKSNIYDPTEPNEDSDEERDKNKNSNIAPDYMRSPTYGTISDFGPHLPLPEPPALPIELESVNNSDSDEEAEFPNMTLYSKTSITLANNVQDIPIPDAEYPSSIEQNEFLDGIPVPIPTTSEKSETLPDSKPVEELYSPSRKVSSDSDSGVEETTEIDNEKTYIRTYSVRSSDRELSSSDDRDSSSDRENRKSRRKVKKYSEESRKTKTNKKVRTSSSENESNEEDKDFSSDSENCIVVHRKRDSSVEEVDSEKSIRKSDGEMSDKASPREHTSSIENDSIDSKTSKPDFSEICDITSKDSINEELVDDKMLPVADVDLVTENDQELIEAEDPKPEGKKDSIKDVSKADDDENDETQPQIIDIDESEKEEASIENEEPIKEKVDDEPKDNVVIETAKTDSSSMAGAYLLPSDDLDPVSDVEDNDFVDYHKLSAKERRRKNKKSRRRDSSVEIAAKIDRELEEGEIEDERTKKKREMPAKKRGRTNESDENLGLSKKQKRRKERKDENKGMSKSENTFTWKKLSKNTKERNYRDGKSKSDKPSEKNKERESNKKKEKRKEIERYDVRKIVSEKPRIVRDEFGRDVSAGRSRSRSVSLARSYNSKRRSSKEHHSRRSLSQDDRWIDWSPVWSQRRSRSRTRRSPRSRSPRNRSRLSDDRYQNVSKTRRPRERVREKRDNRKRRRSLSSMDRYSPSDKKRNKRSPRERGRSRRRSGSCVIARRLSLDDASNHFYRERSWSRSPSLYAHLTPEPNPYATGRYGRSPSMIEPPARISVASPDDGGMLTPNPQNLTVIVPNMDATKKKHKKKKDGKKKKKKQPSKEVFTSGDNIVVSVNFDDNQKIISAKSSKRKNDEENVRSKKKKNSARKKRKQNLRVGEEVLNAKPVAVIDLNSSPCKEMSPMEVISLTDSGDENVTNDNVVAVSERGRTQTSGEAAISGYVMTSAGPKTPPEPSSIKFTVGSTGSLRTIPTNPIFVQDDLDRVDNSSMHYSNKGPNTPPEPSNATPNATMYDPFEPTKSRSPSPAAGKEASLPEQRQTIDMFADDVEKTSSEGQGNDKSTKLNEDNNDGAVTVVSSEESQPKPSPAKETASIEGASGDAVQANGVNTLVLDLSSLGDDFVPKSSIPLVKTSQGKYEFQSNKATPDKPITVVIAQQSTSVKPQPQQVMVTPTRQIPTKPVEPIKQPMFPDILPWKLPSLSQASFATPLSAVSTVTPTTLIGTSAKSVTGALTQNGAQNESFDLDDSPYSPASSEGDDLFEPPPLNANLSPKSRPMGASLPAVNSYKARVDALFNSSPAKKYPRPAPHPKPVSAIKGAKKMSKPNMGGKKEVGIKADEEQLKILDDVPNSAVEMIVKEKFLKKLHRQERVVEEVKVVLKPHYAKKHITKEEYKDILRRAVPKICHNKSGDINPSKIQGLVEAYVKRIRHSKKKISTMNTLPGSAAAPMFPSMGGMTNAAKTLKKQKTLWG